MFGGTNGPSASTGSVLLVPSAQFKRAATKTCYVGFDNIILRYIRGVYIHVYIYMFMYMFILDYTDIVDMGPKV